MACGIRDVCPTTRQNVLVVASPLNVGSSLGFKGGRINFVHCALRIFDAAMYSDYDTFVER